MAVIYSNCSTRKIIIIMEQQETDWHKRQTGRQTNAATQQYNDRTTGTRSSRSESDEQSLPHSSQYDDRVCCKSQWRLWLHHCRRHQPSPQQQQQHGCTLLRRRRASAGTHSQTSRRVLFGLGRQRLTSLSASQLHSCTNHTHTHNFTGCGWRRTTPRLTALCLGLPGSAGTRKVKPIWILLEQETVSGSGTSWAICKSAPRSRQITMPAPHRSGFYRPDALPAAQPTASKHWRQNKLDYLLLLSMFCSSTTKHVSMITCTQHQEHWLKWCSMCPPRRAERQSFAKLS